MRFAIVFPYIAVDDLFGSKSFSIKFGQWIPFKFQGKTLGIPCNWRKKQENSNEA